MTVPGYTSDCPLCKLTGDRDITTRLVYEDDIMIVVDCLICQVPMAVLKAHRPSFSESEKNLVRTIFSKLISSEEPPLTSESLNLLIRRGLISEDTSNLPWVIDWEQRQIPEHPHCHLRPCPFPGTHHWEKITPANS